MKYSRTELIGGGGDGGGEGSGWGVGLESIALSIWMVKRNTIQVNRVSEGKIKISFLILRPGDLFS